MEAEPDIEELEYLLNMGIMGWNLSVLKDKNELLFKKYRKSLFAEKGFRPASKKLVDQLILDKEEKLSVHDAILMHVEITETKKQEVVVNVTAISYEEFISNILTGMKGE